MEDTSPYISIIINLLLEKFKNKLDLNNLIISLVNRLKDFFRA